MDKILAIGVGGFVGAVARYLLSGWAQRLIDSRLPVGTLLVNVLGCLVIGGLLAAAEARDFLSPNLRLFLTMGLLGSFTTFSTFGYETVTLASNGGMQMAILNVGANVVLGVAAVLAGQGLVKALV